MERIEGPISKLRTTIAVGGQNDMVFSEHIATFQVGGRAVRLKTKEAPVLGDGDELVLLGTDRQGLIEALAYRNRTTGTYGDAGSIDMNILGPLFTLVGAGIAFYALLFLNDLTLSLVLAPVGVLVGGVGWHQVVRMHRVREAVAALRAEGC